MSEYKKGDKFIVQIENGEHEFKKGEVVTLIDDQPSVLMSFINDKGRDQLMKLSELEFIDSGYKESNRYKLSQAIKSTGFHAEKLSLATGFKKGYFSDYTSESRFNSRGDITEERLNYLLTTLAFAERELLGVGAKTVDVNESVKDLFKDSPSNATHYIKNNGDKTYFSVDPVGIENPKLSTFTKVGIIVIVILLLILIVKNLVV